MRGACIEQQAGQAYRALADALATSGRGDLAAFGWPGRALHLQRVDPAPAGSAVPDRFARPPTLVRGPAARAMVPGQFDAAAEQAAQAFERLLETLLATAPEDFAIRQLGRDLARTVRQVNVLEQRVAVDLTRARVHVRRTLDEREREEAIRLRRIAAAGPTLTPHRSRPLRGRAVARPDATRQRPLRRRRGSPRRPGP